MCVLTSAKGLTAVFHVDELYFWVNDFAYGFVRRGVIGSLAAPWLRSVTPGDVHAIAVGWWLAGLMCTLLVAAALFWRGLTKHRRAATVAVGALVATSPMLGLITYHVGYPDTVIVALVAATGVFLPSAPAIIVAVAMIGLGAVHEMILLLLLPIVVFCTCMRPCTRVQGAVIGAGAFAALLLPLLSTRPSAEILQRLVLAGLPLADATTQLDTALSQTIAGSASTMYAAWSRHFLNGVLGILYAGLPGGIIMLLGWSAASAWIAARVFSGAGRALLLALYAAACLGPVALLALAWDLSRIASFTTLTAAMTVSLVGRHRDLHASRPLVAVSCAIAGFYLCLPVANLYFDYGRALNTAPIAQACRPCAQAGGVAIDFFNRGLSQDARASIDTDAKYGDAVKTRPRI